MTNSSIALKVFVVHGRNTAIAQAFSSFLRDIGLHPLTWTQVVSLTGQPAPTTLDVVRAGFAHAQAIVILMTGDDIGFLREELRSPDDGTDEREPTPQVRQNVMFESGMAVGAHPDRTLLIQIGRLRWPSDLSGINVVRLTPETPEAKQSIVTRLRNAGCETNTEHRSDWLTRHYLPDPVP